MWWIKFPSDLIFTAQNIRDVPETQKRQTHVQYQTGSEVSRIIVNPLFQNTPNFDLDLLSVRIEDVNRLVRGTVRVRNVEAERDTKEYLRGREKRGIIYRSISFCNSRSGVVKERYVTKNVFM